MGLERGVRAGLVDTHHSRVTGDVSADDGGQPSFHLLIVPEPEAIKPRRRLADCSET
jgi:hypothetical protein